MIRSDLRHGEPKIVAIYAVTHHERVVYVGATTNLQYRIYMHFWSLDRLKHKSTALQEYYNKNGKEGFWYKVLELVDKTKLNEREIHWTAQFEGLLNAMPAGQKYRPELIAKKSMIAKKQMEDPKQRALATARCLENSKAMRDRYYSDEDYRLRHHQNALKVGQRVKELLQDPNRMQAHREGISRRYEDVDYRQNISDKMKAKHSDPEFKRRHSKAIRDRFTRDRYDRSGKIIDTLRTAGLREDDHTP